MSKRASDLAFDVAEQLWRRVEIGDIDKTTTPCTVKANRLRLQISVVRGKHGRRETVTSGKWNGVAEVAAGAVAPLTVGSVRVACVDEPTVEAPGHALIALYMAPGGAEAAADINALRAKVAAKFSVVVVPTPITSPL